MSYDISLRINTGVEERTIAEVGNYTSNVSGMWSKAMGKTMRELDGYSGYVAAPIVEQGVRAMQENPDEYRKMEPDNGWGDYGGALEYLETLLRECRANPLAIIRVSA